MVRRVVRNCSDVSSGQCRGNNQKNLLVPDMHIPEFRDILQHLNEHELRDFLRNLYLDATMLRSAEMQCKLNGIMAKHCRILALEGWEMISDWDMLNVRVLHLPTVNLSFLSASVFFSLVAHLWWTQRPWRCSRRMAQFEKRKQCHRMMFLWSRPLLCCAVSVQPPHSAHKFLPPPLNIAGVVAAYCVLVILTLIIICMAGTRQCVDLIIRRRISPLIALIYAESKNLEEHAYDHDRMYVHLG